MGNSSVARDLGNCGSRGPRSYPDGDRMKKLTDEEHQRYLHLCGKTPVEIDHMESWGFYPCKNCQVKAQCIQDHSLIGADAEAREKLEELRKTENLKSKEVR